MNELERAAREYLELGLRVIALTGKMPNGKVHRHGLHDAFLPGEPYASALERAFTHPDTTGVGILTGPVYYVVDIDGEEGAAAWKELAGEEWMPSRWVAQTGRGLHLWYADAGHEWPTTKLGEKLDFKGVGGYVAAPPSLHPDGHTYKWLAVPGDMPLEMPDPLQDFLKRAAMLRERALVGRQQRKSALGKEPLIDGFIYPTSSFDGIIAQVENEPEGNRNAVLYWAACTMLDEGADGKDLEDLLEAAIESGLASYEARRTILSARRVRA